MMSEGMRFQRLMMLFLSAVIIFCSYAVAMMLLPMPLWQKGTAIFFAAAPTGLYLYHLWEKMWRLIEKADMR